MRSATWTVLAGLAACSGGDDSGDGDDGFIESVPIALSCPVPPGAASFAISEGSDTSPAVSIPIAGVPDAFRFGAVSIDLAATLAFVTFTPTGGTGTGDTLDLTFRVSPAADAATVCTSGLAVGPVQVGLTAGTFAPSGTVTPTTLDLTQEVVDVLNTGDVAVCVETSSPRSGLLGLTHVAWVYTVGEDCSASTPADIAGTWTGPYECSTTCGEPFSGTASIDITQDGDQASYVDGDAVYHGTVCGDVFRFSGGEGDPLGSLYCEGGMISFNGDGTADKSSHWDSGDCTGDCTRDLERE